MILMICATVIPSAADRSLTLTPDGTVTGPVGAATGCCRGGRRPRRRGRAPGGRRGRVLPAVDDDAALAPPAAAARADRSVRLVGAVCHQLSSVVAREPRLDEHGAAQHPVEAARRRPPARSTRAGGTCTRPGRGSSARCVSTPSTAPKRTKLRLRRLATAAGAGPAPATRVTPSGDSSSSTCAATARPRRPSAIG